MIIPKFGGYRGLGPKKYGLDLWFLSLNGAMYIVRIFHSILYGKPMNDDEGFPRLSDFYILL